MAPSCAGKTPIELPDAMAAAEQSRFTDDPDRTTSTSQNPTYGAPCPIPSSFRVARRSGVSRHGFISIAHGQGTCLHEDMIRKVSAIVGSAVFLVIAPGFVAGLVPWWISRWQLETPFLGCRFSVLAAAGWWLWGSPAF